MYKRLIPALSTLVAITYFGITIYEQKRSAAVKEEIKAGKITPDGIIYLDPRKIRDSEFTGRMFRVLDGVNIEFKFKRKVVRVRLFGLMTPDAAAPAAGEGKAFVLEALRSGTHQVLIRRRTSKELIGTVVLPSGKGLNGELVRRGLAWVTKEAPVQPELLAIEAAARQEERGMWGDKAEIK